MSTALYAAYNRQEQIRLKRKRNQLDAETRRFTRNIRQKTTQIPNLALLVNQTTNENVALSMRVTWALEMWEKMFQLDVAEVVKLMATQPHLIMKLADASLHTSYVPLQQLFLMSLASLLSTLNASRNNMTIAARQRFREILWKLDKTLLSALPMDEVVEVIDPGNASWARNQVNAMNRNSNVCRTCIIQKCYVSSCGKYNLMPLVVEKWLDFGGTTLTFYQQLPHETILYNIPYNCIERLEFVEETCLGFIFTKRAVGLYGINLAAFVVASSDFSVFRDTVTVTSSDSIRIRKAPSLVETCAKSSNATETIHHGGGSKFQTSRQNYVRSCTTPIKPMKPIITPTAEPNYHHYSATMSIRLVTGITISTVPSTSGHGTPTHRTQSLDTMIRRACEETTPTIKRITPPAITTDANLRCRELVLARTKNTVSSPKTSHCHEAMSNSCFRFTTISTPFSWIRTIQTQLRELLLNSARTAFLDLPTDSLKRAKAECLADLKESMGYVEELEASFSGWSIFVIALLIVAPWSLLVVKMYNF